MTPGFEEGRNGRDLVIRFFAKGARGLLARHAITRCIEDPVRLQAFRDEGYLLTPPPPPSADGAFVAIQRTLYDSDQ